MALASAQPAVPGNSNSFVIVTNIKSLKAPRWVGMDS